MFISDLFAESHDMEDSEGYEENPEGASPIDVVWEMPLTYRKKSEVVDAAIRLLAQHWGSYTANQIASEPGFTEELIDAYNYVLKQSRNVNEDIAGSIKGIKHTEYVFAEDEWTYIVTVQADTDSGIPDLYSVTFSSNPNNNKKFSGSVTVMRSNKYTNPASPKGKKLIAAAQEYLTANGITPGQGNVTEAGHRCEGSNYLMSANAGLAKSLNLKNIDPNTVEIDCIKCRKRVKAKKQLRTGKWKIAAHHKGEVTEAAMTPQEQRLRDVISNPYYHAEDEHGTYVRAENRRAIAAAKRMLKAGEVADVVDKSFATGKGTSVGGEAYFDPFTKSWGNYRKQSVEPLAHVYIKLNGR